MRVVEFSRGVVDDEERKAESGYTHRQYAIDNVIGFDWTFQRLLIDFDPKIDEVNESRSKGKVVEKIRSEMNLTVVSRQSVGPENV